MYNQELKEQFVSEHSKNEGKREVLHTLFGALGKHEERLGKDFCQMNAEELRQVVPEVIGSRSVSRSARKVTLHTYCQWCVDRGVPGAGMAIREIDFNDLSADKLRRQSVANPQHLQRYMDTIFEKETEDTVDLVYRCFFWLAYIGIMRDEDALNIDVSDVDLDAMAVHFGGKDYPMCRESIYCIKKCATLQEFRFLHPNYGLKIKSRTPGTKLLRGLMGAVSLPKFRCVINRKIRLARTLQNDGQKDPSLDLSLSYNRVWLSGRFYTMLENERAGMSVDFTYLAEEFMEGKEYNLSSGRNLIGAKERQIAKSYMRDYERWKSVYSV